MRSDGLEGCSRTLLPVGPDAPSLERAVTDVRVDDDAVGVVRGRCATRAAPVDAAGRPQVRASDARSGAGVPPSGAV